MTIDPVPQKYVTLLRALEFEQPSPTMEEAILWFRQFGYYTIVLHRFGNTDHCYRIYTPDDTIDSPKDFKTYEEAELACLEKLIELKHNRK